MFFHDMEIDHSPLQVNQLREVEYLQDNVGKHNFNEWECH